MRAPLLACLLLLIGSAQAAEFASPIRLKGGDTIIRVESPGYACACWADVDGDGKKDLLVGQFLGKGKLAEGDWLRAEGKIAEVPGVW